MFPLARRLFFLEVMEHHLFGYLLLHLLISQIVLEEKSAGAVAQGLLVPSLLARCLRAVTQETDELVIERVGQLHRVRLDKHTLRLMPLMQSNVHWQDGKIKSAALCPDRLFRPSQTMVRFRWILQPAVCQRHMRVYLTAAIIHKLSGIEILRQVGTLLRVRFETCQLCFRLICQRKNLTVTASVIEDLHQRFNDRDICHFTAEGVKRQHLFAGIFQTDDSAVYISFMRHGEGDITRHSGGIVLET